MTVIPQAIGKYTLVREIGRGATAHVYLARDTFAERDVALKIFVNSSDEASEFAKKHRSVFLNEAALVGKLQHPHIVTLLDAAVERDFSYIAMDFAPGGTLERFTTPDKLLPLEKVVEVVFKASRALEYAHRQGVIHRDIKPANILVNDNFDVKVSDFGVARLENATHTEIANVGSPAYMSPEQLGDQPLTLQTDIYSLGVVMYQLLTGRLPFTGSSHASLMYQIINHQPPSLRTVRPEIPEAFEAIVLRAMQKDVRVRYQSWIEFGKDLAGLVSNLAVPRESISDTRKFHALRNLSIFRDFREVEIWEVLRISTWQSLPRDTLIIQEGDRSESFFVLVEGNVDVDRGGHYLATLGSGECFGEMLYFTGDAGVRSTSIRAKTDVFVIEIRPEALLAASDACQLKFNHAFIRILSRRLTEANKKLAGR